MQGKVKSELKNNGKKKYHGRCQEPHRKVSLQLGKHVMYVPQTSGPITQTSPDTERGGRQDRIRENHPRPSPRKKNQINKQTNKQTTKEHTCQRKPRPENSENGNKLKNYPPESRKTSSEKKSRTTAEKRKSAIHGGASRFVYVTLDPPCKCASQVKL